MVKLFKKKLVCKLLGKHIKIGQSRVDALTEIGDYTYIGNNCGITKTKIGRYVSIADNVTVGPGEHDLSIFSTSAYFYDKPFEVLCKDDCVIGNDVWIGVDSIIRRGVKVGNGAIIGANSFVNKDVPDYAIVVGNPAKLLRYRFDKETQEKLSASAWWDKTPEEVKSIFEEIKLAQRKDNISLKNLL